jgi:hypothetical protein
MTYDVYTNKYQSALDTRVIGHNVVGRFDNVADAINACIAYSTHYGVGRVFVVASDGTFITSRMSY